jgi:ABC-type lipoprotein release transport system permease subunit
MDNSLVYTSLPAAQQFIDMPDGYSGILISLKNDNKLKEAMTIIAQVVATSDAPLVQKNTDEIDAGGYEILSWHLTMQNLLQSSASDQAFGKMALFILYLIVGFGILGTVIMLTNERRRELRTMISLGMSRSKLTWVMTLELLFMSLLGAIAGLMLALPVSYYFYFNPIKVGGDLGKMFLDVGMDPLISFSINPQIFITQVVTVIFLTAIAAIYPVRFIKKLKLNN